MPLLSTVSPAPTDPIIGALLQLGAAVPNLVPGESRQEVLALRQRMTSAGHDLRQPLQVIGYALSRLSRSLASERDRAWLQAAMSQTSRLAEGLADLVAAARDEVPDGAFETVGLAELTFDVARDWSLHAVEHGVDLKVMRASGAVRSHRKRLRAIIDNLVGNAIKYAPDGRVRLGFRRSSTGLSLVVIDDGIGISPEDQERIFEAFLQVDGKSEGLGLGLSLVADHCRVLGHTLRLSSEPGRGSCFSVDLGSPVPSRQV
ncbi:MAG: sensor histidine kinase [Janthinobacterium lividum]